MGSEILGVIVNDALKSFGKEKTFEVDTTKKTPEWVLNEVNEIINKKKGGDVVDWLSLVAEKNDMNRFFDY